MKEAWQQTKEEYLEKMKPYQLDSTSLRFHRVAIESAISRGESIPREVLEDYPDLLKKINKSQIMKDSSRKEELKRKVNEIDKRLINIRKSGKKEKEPTDKELSEVEDQYEEELEDEIEDETEDEIEDEIEEETEDETEDETNEEDDIDIEDIGEEEDEDEDEDEEEYNEEKKK